MAILIHTVYCIVYKICTGKGYVSRDCPPHLGPKFIVYIHSIHTVPISHWETLQGGHIRWENYSFTYKN